MGARVVEREESVQIRTGFKMALVYDGKQENTVSAAQVEQDCLRVFEETFKQTPKSFTRWFQEDVLPSDRVVIDFFKNKEASTVELQLSKCDNAKRGCVRIIGSYLASVSAL